MTIASQTESPRCRDAAPATIGASHTRPQHDPCVGSSSLKIPSLNPPGEYSLRCRAAACPVCAATAGTVWDGCSSSRTDTRADGWTIPGCVCPGSARAMAGALECRTPARRGRLRRCSCERDSSAGKDDLLCPHDQGPAAVCCCQR